MNKGTSFQLPSLTKRKPVGKPGGKLTPQPIKIGNPRAIHQPPTQPFIPQPSLDSDPIIRLDPRESNGFDEVPQVDLDPRLNALQRMMGSKKLKQSPIKKFKPIGIPQQPIQQQGNSRDLYMQRMTQQLEQQGRMRF